MADVQTGIQLSEPSEVAIVNSAAVVVKAMASRLGPGSACERSADDLDEPERTAYVLALQILTRTYHGMLLASGVDQRQIEASLRG